MRNKSCQTYCQLPLEALAHLVSKGLPLPPTGLYLSHLCVAGEHPKNIESILSEFGVFLRTSAYGMDTKPLLKEACSKVRCRFHVIHVDCAALPL